MVYKSSNLNGLTVYYVTMSQFTTGIHLRKVKYVGYIFTNNDKIFNVNIFENPEYSKTGNKNYE